jgi:predicted ATPase
MIEQHADATKGLREQLILSQKLYGRESELTQIFSAFERVTQGGAEAVLISGYAGIGKSSLAKELYKTTVAAQGFFITGKYDQLQRAIPYSAFLEAFENLIQLLLVLPPDKLHTLKQELIEKLGNNIQVICEIAPSLNLLIGSQERPAELPPIEAQNRFLLTLKSFIKILAKNEHPLVLFLDDMQWIDSASLQLLTVLLLEHDLHYFLLIGAYRDNEVNSSHPLLVTLQHASPKSIPITRIELSPLSDIDIQLFLAESFKTPVNQVLDLATLLAQKTYGNPFFINELLKLLYYKKSLTFSLATYQWAWDIAAIQQHAFIDDVVELLTARIKQLPEASQTIIKLAACIGYTFDLATLSIISEYSIDELLELLQPITEATLIKTLDKVTTYISDPSTNTTSIAIQYQFLHDKIQQAAYELMPEDTRKKLHLQIGRLLLKNNVLQEGGENLFDIVSHFLACADLITEQGEKEKIARYFLWAGKKAKIATAYQNAKNYLQAGLQLLTAINWNDATNLPFMLCKELAICQYLTGEFAQAEDVFKILFKNAQNNLDKLEVYKINCEMLSTTNRHLKALSLGKKALRLVNIYLPENPNKAHILFSTMKVLWQQAYYKLNVRTLQPIKNPDYSAALELISQLLNSAFVTNKYEFIMLNSVSIHISLRYGYDDSTTMVF